MHVLTSFKRSDPNYAQTSTTTVNRYAFVWFKYRAQISRQFAHVVVVGARARASACSEARFGNRRRFYSVPLIVPRLLFTDILSISCACVCARARRRRIDSASASSSQRPTPKRRPLLAAIGCRRWFRFVCWMFAPNEYYIDVVQILCQLVFFLLFVVHCSRSSDIRCQLRKRSIWNAKSRTTPTNCNQKNRKKWIKFIAFLLYAFVFVSFQRDTCFALTRKLVVMSVVLLLWIVCRYFFCFVGCSFSVCFEAPLQWLKTNFVWNISCNKDFCMSSGLDDVLLSVGFTFVNFADATNFVLHLRLGCVRLLFATNRRQIKRTAIKWTVIDKWDTLNSIQSRNDVA